MSTVRGRDRYPWIVRGDIPIFGDDPGRFEKKSTSQAGRVTLVLQVRLATGVVDPVALLLSSRLDCCVDGGFM